MAPFKPGDRIITKAKPQRSDKIVGARVGGSKHQWDVELEDGSSRVLKSQQLLKPKTDTAPDSTDNAYLPTTRPPPRRAAAAAAAVPSLEETDVSSSHNEDKAEGQANYLDSDSDSEDDDDDEVLAYAANALTLGVRAFTKVKLSLDQIVSIITDYSI
jgi:hypothetical protein